jgi:hypothetical protein
MIKIFNNKILCAILYWTTSIMFMFNYFVIHIYKSILYYVPIKYIATMLFRTITMVKLCVICGNVDEFDGVSVHRLLMLTISILLLL